MLQPAPLAVSTRFEQGLWDNFRIARHSLATRKINILDPS
jgi:hypothetical protein